MARVPLFAGLPGLGAIETPILAGVGAAFAVSPPYNLKKTLVTVRMYSYCKGYIRTEGQGQSVPSCSMANPIIYANTHQRVFLSYFLLMTSTSIAAAAFFAGAAAFSAAAFSDLSLTFHCVCGCNEYHHVYALDLSLSLV